MAAHFNVIDLTPVRTYASPENAIKAVAKWAEKANFSGRAFNVVIMDCRMGTDAEDRRYYPLICNVAPDFFHAVIHSGFNVIN